MGNIKTYRIETERLVIRCYQPADAELLYNSLNCGTEHLMQWLPWAKTEPLGIEEQIDKLRMFRAKYDAGQDYIMGIFNSDESELLGGTGLHPRIGNNAMEIGYWLSASHLRKGIITESTQALVRVGFEVEQLQRIEIHCDPNNTASANIPHKLGFLHEVTLRNRSTDVNGNPRDTMIWTMFREDYTQHFSKQLTLQAYDCAGRKIASM